MQTISPTEGKLQKYCLNAWCKYWRLRINRDKTKVLHFRNKNISRSKIILKCGDTIIDYDTNYRYLGLNVNEFYDYKHYVREIIKAASRALSALYTKLIAFGGMSYDVYSNLYRSLVEHVLYYGAG